MLLQRLAGSQNHCIPLWLADGSSTSGAGKTGLSGTSAGLIIAVRADGQATPTVYTAAAGTIDTIATIGQYVAPTAGKCRFKEVDPTNEPGTYELQISNILFATGTWLKITIQAPGSSVPVQQFIYDLQPQVDVRSLGGSAGQFNNGVMSVDIVSLGGNASALTKLLAEMGVRMIGTITAAGIAPTASVFECSDINDVDDEPVYQNRGVLALSGANLRRAGVILTDQVGTAGRRFTVTTAYDSYAAGDTILVL